ncbi:MAG TPA: response regulator, partial [Candidatus Acidoferrales bacterium]|nr:response regulator [Candidatus Acidoferrales bacterium]
MSSILVAEDDRTTRTLLRGVLKGAGFKVKTVADGRAALKQLRAKKYDLVLTDIWMPHVNGLELLALLRAEPVHPRVMVMTSDDTPETLLRAVREQAYQYVKKPVESKALVELLRDALAAKPSSPPIEVLSARPNWVELLVPCELEAAARITNFLKHLKSDVPAEVRERVGQAFRELLTNAIEWGGKLDPNQKVRISYLR